MMLLTLGSSILQVAFQCHDIVEAIPYFQIWECLFLVHMNNAALNFVLLPFFGNSFVRTSSAQFIILIAASLKKLFRSIVDDNLMSLQMIMIATECN